MSQAIQDAIAEMQTPGLSIGMRGASGRGGRIEDPAAVFARVAETAEIVDGATEPWPRTEGEPDEYVVSQHLSEIGSGMIGSIVRLAHLRMFRIHYVYRHKETWESKGRTVYGQMKKPSGLLKHFAEADYVVLVNWLVWKAMNPMQRVALVYHELRHGDPEGKVRGHDFEGFFDELALFGTETYRDWHTLAESVRKGRDVRHQYSLDLSALDTDDS